VIVYQVDGSGKMINIEIEALEGMARQRESSDAAASQILDSGLKVYGEVSSRWILVKWMTHE
jgi:hypothetical protein